GLRWADGVVGPLSGSVSGGKRITVTALAIECEVASVKANKLGHYAFDKLPASPADYQIAAAAHGQVFHPTTVRVVSGLGTDVTYFFVAYDLARGAEAPTFSPILTTQLSALNSQLTRLGLPTENLRRFLTTSARNLPSMNLDLRPNSRHTFELRYVFLRDSVR